MTHAGHTERIPGPGLESVPREERAGHDRFEREMVLEGVFAQ